MINSFFPKWVYYIKTYVDIFLWHPNKYNKAISRLVIAPPEPMLTAWMPPLFINSWYLHKHFYLHHRFKRFIDKHVSNPNGCFVNYISTYVTSLRCSLRIENIFFVYLYVYYANCGLHKHPGITPQFCARCDKCNQNSGAIRWSVSCFSV